MPRFQETMVPETLKEITPERATRRPKFMTGQEKRHQKRIQQKSKKACNPNNPHFPASRQPILPMLSDVSDRYEPGGLPWVDVSDGRIDLENPGTLPS